MSLCDRFLWGLTIFVLTQCASPGGPEEWRAVERNKPVPPVWRSFPFGKPQIRNGRALLVVERSGLIDLTIGLRQAQIWAIAEARRVVKKLGQPEASVELDASNIEDIYYECFERELAVAAHGTRKCSVFFYFSWNYR